MSKQFYFLDIETTGLDENQDEILEVAYVVTDEGFNLLYEREFLIEQEPHWEKTWSRINDNKVVRHMHTASGLLADLANDDKPKTTLDDVYDILERDLRRDSYYGKNILAGRSVHFDKSFLIANDFSVLFDDSQPASFFHRMLDLSAVKVMLEASGIDPSRFEVTNSRPHRAIDDVKADILYAQNISHYLKEASL